MIIGICHLTVSAHSGGALSFKLPVVQQLKEEINGGHAFAIDLRMLWII